MKAMKRIEKMLQEVGQRKDHEEKEAKKQAKIESNRKEKNLKSVS